MVVSHERLAADDDVRGGSDRSFGITFAVVFTLIALFPLLHGGSVRLWALPGTAVFGGIALIWPSLLAPLNRLWFRFGMLLHKIVNPIVMGILFFVVFTPMGFIMRLAGKDLLSLKRDSAASSYWSPRQASSEVEASMKNQF